MIKEILIVSIISIPICAPWIYAAIHSFMDEDDAGKIIIEHPVIKENKNNGTN